MEEENPSLKRQELRDDVGIMGLPLPLFVLALFLSGFGTTIVLVNMGLLIGILIGIPFTFVVFVPLQLAHKDDIRAYLLWISVLKTPDFSSEKLKKKVVVIMKRGEVLTFKNWKKEHEQN